MKKIVLVGIVGLICLSGCSSKRYGGCLILSPARNDDNSIVAIKKLTDKKTSFLDNIIIRKNVKTITESTPRKLKIIEKAKEIIDEIVKAENAGMEYIVGSWSKDRECLWNIADKIYGDPWQWKKIYESNKDRISDPNLIDEGMKLLLPY